jgi:hypothetical protein
MSDYTNLKHWKFDPILSSRRYIGFPSYSYIIALLVHPFLVPPPSLTKFHSLFPTWQVLVEAEPALSAYHHHECRPTFILCSLNIISDV